MKVRRGKDGWTRKVDNKMHAYGDNDFAKKVIRVNKKKAKKSPVFKRPITKHASKYPELLDTIVHEEMHRTHPKRTEKQVRIETKNKLKRMTPAVKRKHYAMYA